MQLMVTLLANTYVRGWMTVSGCTRAGEVRVITYVLFIFAPISNYVLFFFFVAGD